MSVVVPTLCKVETYEVDDSGDLIIHDAAEGRMLVVNPVGAAAFTLIDGERDSDSIISEIGVVFADVPRESIERDVHAFLAELEKWGVLTLRPLP